MAWHIAFTCIHDLSGCVYGVQFLCIVSLCYICLPGCMASQVFDMNEHMCPCLQTVRAFPDYYKEYSAADMSDSYGQAVFSSVSGELAQVYRRQVMAEKFRFLKIDGGYKRRSMH